MKCLSVGFAVLVVLVGGSVTSGNVVFQDGFDDYPINLPPDGWDQEGGQPVVVVDTLDCQGGQSVHFDDTSSSDKAYISHDFQPTSFVQLDYCMMTGNSAYEGVNSPLEGDAGHDYTVIFSNGAWPNSSAGWIGVFGETHNWVEAELLQYEVDTWYHVRRTLNCTTDTGLFEVWERDDPSNYASYSIGADRPINYVHRIKFGTSTSQRADVYVDQVSVQAVPEPSSLIICSLLAAVAAGYGWYRRRKAA